MSNNFCKTCGRRKGKKNHINGLCDLVVLSDGRSVHSARVEDGGDLNEAIYRREIKIVHRYITPEMRRQAGWPRIAA